MELPGMGPDDKEISFTPNEWNHLVDEFEKRKGREIAKCVNNARYLAKRDIADEQIKNGQVVTVDFEGLEYME